MAASGPRGDVRVDAPHGRHDRALLPGAWDRPAAFLSSGTSGQWCHLLDDADLARYAARVRNLASDDLVNWAHIPPID